MEANVSMCHSERYKKKNKLNNLEAIQSSDIHARLGLEKGKYILLSAHREENIDTEKNFTSLPRSIRWLRSMTCRFCILAIRDLESGWKHQALNSTLASLLTNLSDSMITTACR